MAALNEVSLIGNLGRDPEMRHTQNGTAVCNFSIATNESYKNKDGENVERVEWHRIVAWQKLAEICDQYLHKGKQVYIRGRLQTRDWEDKDGAKRYTTEIVAQRMLMLGSKSDDSGGSRSADPGPGDGDQFGPPTDDIPF